MKRLTERDEKGTAMLSFYGESCTNNFICETGEDIFNCIHLDYFIDRVADIEDILGDDYDLEKVRELLKGDTKMKNVVVERESKVDLNKKLHLNNGSLVILKKGQVISEIYYVIPFSNLTSDGRYCALMNLDSGEVDFRFKCSRLTSVGSVIRHITSASNKVHTPDLDVEVIELSGYTMRIKVHE